MALPKILFWGQCVCAALMIIGMLAQRSGALPFKAAFGGFALGLLCAAIVALVALIAVLLSFGVISAEYRGFSVGALLLGLIPFVMVMGIVGAGFKVPKIHDISTNLDDNIIFQHGQTLRSAQENSLELPGKTVVEAHRNHYTSLSSLSVADSPGAAYKKALSAAKALGWEVYYESADGVQFEALEKTAMFGFTDDIAVRIQANGEGSAIDTRSVSRVGVSDLGANARRILRFQEVYKMQ